MTRTAIAAAFLLPCAFPGMAVHAADGHFDVKGITLGISESDLETIGAIPLSCGTVSDASSHRSEPTDRICHQRPAGMSVLDTLKPWQSFAGIPTTFTFWILDGKVGKIQLSDINPHDFSKNVATMETKYGKAKIVEQKLQNRMGATFNDATATWTSAAGDVIVYKRYRETLDGASILNFYSADYWKAMQEMAGAKRSEAESDM